MGAHAEGGGMNWGSLDSFLAMGGYGFYVWGSYGVTALCIVLEILSLNTSKGNSKS
jgi:heme exporter protein D